MKKFLVLYNMPSEGFEAFKDATGEDKEKDMADWRAWMEKNKDSFADGGNPVGVNKRVTSDGVSDTPNEVGGYAMVLAENHDAACSLFNDAPHLKTPGTYVEVMEVVEMG